MDFGFIYKWINENKTNSSYQGKAMEW